MGTGQNNPSLVVGTNSPLTGATIYFSAKCPTAGTDYLKVLLSGGTSPAVFGGGSCTTSYQTYSVEFPWGSSGNQNGAYLTFQGKVGSTWSVCPCVQGGKQCYASPCIPIILLAP
jgi:hypothetical protein